MYDLAVRCDDLRLQKESLEGLVRINQKYKYKGKLEKYSVLLEKVDTLLGGRAGEDEDEAEEGEETGESFDVRTYFLESFGRICDSWRTLGFVDSSLSWDQQIRTPIQMMRMVTQRRMVAGIGKEEAIQHW